jgi:uncharacterized protein YjbI with pentapeptide repeats
LKRVSDTVLVIIKVLVCLLIFLVGFVIIANYKLDEVLLNRFLGTGNERAATYRLVPAGLGALLTALIAVYGVIHSVELNNSDAALLREANYKATLQSRFAVATAQLESESAYSKINAVNTLALLADEWQEHSNLDINGNERALCLEALTAYLKNPVDEFNEEGEKLVREAIVRQLRNHLLVGNRIHPSWSDYSFDFTGATFYGLDLGGCKIGKVSFRQATFSGDASFSGTTFSESAHFDYTTFDGVADFDYATFDGVADFEHTTFYGYAYFHFREAKFTSGRTAEFPQYLSLQDNGLPLGAFWSDTENTD